MKDIAELVGCSQASVSHVLTGTGTGNIRVSDKKAARIREVARQLHFRPNLAAQQLRGKCPSTLGMISSDWRDHLQLRNFCWVQEATSKRGYKVFAAEAKSKEQVRDTVDELQSRGVEAVLCFAAKGAIGDPAALEILAEIPHIVSLFGRTEIPGSVFVNIDWAEATRLAVAHLAETGRRRIALFLGNMNSENDLAQRSGFEAALSECGLGPEAGRCFDGSGMIYDMPEVWDRLDAALDLAMDDWGADAIITYDDYLAALFIQRLTLRGLRVPDDLALVGQENDLVAPHLNPPLTTIQFPILKVVETAVAMLVGAVESPGSKPLQSKVIPPELVVRGST